jgi:hypothetical protein
MAERHGNRWIDGWMENQDTKRAWKNHLGMGKVRNNIARNKRGEGKKETEPRLRSEGREDERIKKGGCWARKELRLLPFPLVPSSDISGLPPWLE